MHIQTGQHGLFDTIDTRSKEVQGIGFPLVPFPFYIVSTRSRIYRSRIALRHQRVRQISEHIRVARDNLIRDVILFPTLKSLEVSDSKSSDSKGGNPFFTPNSQIDFSGVKVEDFLTDEVDFDTFCKSDFRAVKVLECEAVPKSKKLLKFVLDDGTDEKRVILSGIHAFYEPEQLIGKTLIAITNLPPRSMMGMESNGMLLSALHKEEGEEKLNLLMVDPHIPAGAKLY